MEIKDKTCCDEVSSLIIEYIDGELDGETARLAARHIEECNDCRKLYSDMRAVCQAASESAHEAPAELHCRVMAAVRAERRRLKIKRISTYAGIGVAAMLTISIGFATLLGHLGFLSSHDREKIGATGMLEGSDAAYLSSSEHYIFSNSGSALNDLYRANVAAAEAENKAMQSYIEPDCREDSASEVKETDQQVSSEISLGETTPASAHDAAHPPASSRLICLAGEWKLVDNTGGVLVLSLLNATDFSLTNASGHITAGNYEVSGEVITFIYNGGRAEYAFGLSENALSLSHIRGERLIGDK